MRNPSSREHRQTLLLYFWFHANLALVKAYDVPIALSREQDIEMFLVSHVNCSYSARLLDV